MTCVHDGDEVFEIVAGEVVSQPASPGVFNLGSNEVGRGDTTQSEAIAKAYLGCGPQGIGKLTIGKAVYLCVERHYIEKKALILPAAERSTLARVLLKPKLTQSFREDCVLSIGSNLGDDIHIIGSADWSGSGDR